MKIIQIEKSLLPPAFPISKIWGEWAFDSPYWTSDRELKLSNLYPQIYLKVLPFSIQGLTKVTEEDKYSLPLSDWTRFYKILKSTPCKKETAVARLPYLHLVRWKRLMGIGTEKSFVEMLLGPVLTGTASGNKRNSLFTTLSSRKWREISILPSVLSVREGFHTGTRRPVKALPKAPL